MEPGGQPAADVPTTRHGREIVEPSQQPVTGEPLQHTETERGTANAATRQTQCGRPTILPGVNRRVYLALRGYLAASHRTQTVDRRQFVVGALAGGFSLGFNFQAQAQSAMNAPGAPAHRQGRVNSARVSGVRQSSYPRQDRPMIRRSASSDHRAARGAGAHRSERMAGPRPTPTHVERPFDVAELFFSTTNRKGIIQSGNDVFARVSGYTEAELLGQPHNVIRHPDMPRAVFRLLWDYLEAERPIAAYVQLPRQQGDSVASTQRIDDVLLVDRSADGRALEHARRRALEDVIGREQTMLYGRVGGNQQTARNEHETAQCAGGTGNGRFCAIGRIGCVMGGSMSPVMEAVAGRRRKRIGHAGGHGSGVGRVVVRPGGSPMQHRHTRQRLTRKDQDQQPADDDAQKGFHGNWTCHPSVRQTPPFPEPGAVRAGMPI